MIRTPAIEIINYLKKIDLSQPAYRFILCRRKIFFERFLVTIKHLNWFNKLQDGLQNGTGKKCSLFHLLHYAHKDNWLIVHLPDC